VHAVTCLLCLLVLCRVAAFMGSSLVAEATRECKGGERLLRYVPTPRGRLCTSCAVRCCSVVGPTGWC
jgi:hypothetical protein